MPNWRTARSISSRAARGCTPRCFFAARSHLPSPGGEAEASFVWIDRRPEGGKVNFVGVDHEEIGRMATRHLIEMGCRRIAHIGGPGIGTALGRLKGYRQALQRHRLPAGSEYVISRDHVDVASDAAGYHAMNRLLGLKNAPDGVFCYDDPTAMGAMQAAIEKGIRIPRDLALIGAGKVRYARFCACPCRRSTSRAGRSGIARPDSRSGWSARSRRPGRAPSCGVRSRSCANPAGAAEPDRIPREATAGAAGDRA